MYQNFRNYGENLVAYECLRSNSDDLRVIISDQRIRIVTCSPSNNNVTTVIESSLRYLLQNNYIFFFLLIRLFSDFETCKTITEREGSETRHYIEITIHISGSSAAALVYQDAIKKPRVRCDSAEIAEAVRGQLNYAKRLYVERLHTLIAGENNELFN